MTSRRTTRLHECKRCHIKKHAWEMRHPSSSRGKAPTTCHACRIADPTNHWCDYHNELHPTAQFGVVDRPYPYHNICRDGVADKKSEKSSPLPRKCVACAQELPSRQFRGGRLKSPTCKNCQDANTGQRWCEGCETFVPDHLFARTGVDGKFQTTRCRPCRTAWSHGVTVEWVLNKQGVTTPECAACGSTADLKIDHDHKCCASANGCPSCVRGYLCHGCNTAEGLLKTADRALKLAAYIERVTGSKVVAA